MSELVLPVRNGRGEVVAVWDLDSAEPADFGAEDVQAMEVLTALLEERWSTWTWS
jgi:putative methionine-R-sulfoxide reductase with GAF domain